MNEEEQSYRDHSQDPLQDNLGAILPSQPVQPTPRINPEWRRFFRAHPHLRRTLGVVGTSIITSLVVVALIVAVGWSHRDKIAALLASTLPTPAASVAALTPNTAAPATTTASEGPKDLSVTEVVAKVNPSVVSIEVSQAASIFSRTVGKGTGFFVSSDGYIITNRHVVDFTNATFQVTTTAGKKYTATLIAKDPVFDLAVLKVLGSGFPAVTLGDSDTLQLGQSVVAIGFALGEFQNSISTGVISGLSRSITAGGSGTSEQLDRVIQTDAAINPGNSGGPLINLKGEVVGVNVAVAQGSQNVGFSIPADNVAEVVRSVKAYGTIVRPYVGISYAQIDAAVQRSNNLSVDYGVYVTTVLLDSPAARAGIQSGDIILSIDGAKLDGDPSFAGLIRGKRVGQTITVVILRNGVQSTLKVTLAQAPTS